MAETPAPERQNPNPLASFAATSGGGRGATGFDAGDPQTPDTDIQPLILEFALRQRAIPDNVVNALLFKLTLPNPIYPRFKKAILIRRLASELALPSVSERSLETLELIEELDRDNRSLPPSQAMKSAYCAVATSCTSTALRRNVDDFLDSFNRIWVKRISHIEMSAAASLISEELYEVRGIFWEAVKDQRIRDLVVNDDLMENMDFVREYLEQEWSMEPLFPEVIVDKVVKDLRVSGERRDRRRGLSDIEEEQALKSSDCNLQRILPDTLLNLGNKATGLLVDNSEETCNMKYKENDGLDRRVDLASNSETGFDDTSIGGKETDSHHEQALRPSYKRMVQDTFLDTTNETSESLAKIPKEACNLELGENDGQHRRDELAAAFDVGASAEKVPDITPDKENCSTQNNQNLVSLPRTNLMERNPTAHTYKWTESPPQESPPQEGRIKLHSPRRESISPLKLIGNKWLTKRRKKRMWTLKEEETLINAVREHGKGCWKTILKNNPTIFEERTEIDLKDKWRNMTK